MGQGSSPGFDSGSQRVVGTFTATGVSGSKQFNDALNIQLSGTFVGTATLERSFDGGVTFVSLSTDTTGTANSYSVPVSLTLFEPEQGVLYRWRCSSFTSGTMSYRISQ